MSIKDSLVVFTEGARVNFRLYGYILPVFAGLLDNEPQIFPVIWENLEAKESFAKQIYDWIASNRLKEFILVSEVWTALIQEVDRSKVQDWLKTHGSLENWPARKEMVMVQYCSPREEIEYTAEIIRGIVPHATTLGEWKINTQKVELNSEDFSTRFQGLFFRSKAGQN